LDPWVGLLYQIGEVVGKLESQQNGS